MTAASSDFDPDETFSEEDRPLEEVLAAYERGTRGVTARPDRIELTAAPQICMPVPPSQASRARVTYLPARPDPIQETSRLTAGKEDMMPAATASRAYIPYDVPLGEGERARLILPQDLSVSEAVRLCAVIRAISFPDEQIAEAQAEFARLEAQQALAARSLGALMTEWAAAGEDEIFADAPYLDTLLSNSAWACPRCQKWEDDCKCPAA